MIRHNCFWNGQPATCCVVNVFVHSVKQPKAHWQNAFAGDLRQALIIEQDGVDFMIDNAAGDGWLKVTEGRGTPHYGSKHISACTVINEVDPLFVNKVYNQEIYSLHAKEFKEWYKKTHPNDFKRYQELIKRSNEIKKGLR